MRNSLILVLSLLVAAIVTESQPANAQFVLDPPILIDSSARFTKLAVSGDGQKIIISWVLGKEILYRSSRDGGSFFGPVTVAAEAPPNPPGSDTAVDFFAESAPIITPDGSRAAMLAAVEANTLYAPILLPPFSTMARVRVYASSDMSGAFVQSHYVATLTDFREPESWLTGFHTTMHLETDGSGQSYFGVWNIFLLGRSDRNVVFARGGRASPLFETPIDLSELPFSEPFEDDRDPKIAVDEAGIHLFVAWERRSSTVLVRSSDGGQTWEQLDGLSAGSKPDIGFARTGGRLVVLSSPGIYPQPTRIAFILSEDLGETFGPEKIVAEGSITPRVIVSKPRVAISTDGEVIAVLYSQENCDPVWGCGILPVEIRLAVSQDGGLSFEGLGVVAETYFDNTYDVTMDDEGRWIYLVAENEGSGAAVFRRAVR